MRYWETLNCPPSRMSGSAIEYSPDRYYSAKTFNRLLHRPCPPEKPPQVVPGSGVRYYQRISCNTQTDSETKLLYCEIFRRSMSQHGPRTRSNLSRSIFTHLSTPLATTVAARGRFSRRAISPENLKKKNMPIQVAVSVIVKVNLYSITSKQ